jgi:uncharacterized protein
VLCIKRMIWISAALILVLGITMLNRGFNSSRFNFTNSVSFEQLSGKGFKNIARIEGGFQVVTTNLESGKYTPFIVQSGVPVKWTIKAAESDINGCNGVVKIPKFGISKKLVPGDNLIEFIPKETGDITYTCWMGMIGSNIKVVADVTKISNDVTLPSGTNRTVGSSDGYCGIIPVWFLDDKIPTNNIQIAKLIGKSQEATVTVNYDGYTPAVLVLQKGIKAKIKFNTEQLSSCNSIIVFPKFNGQLNLNTVKETPIITPTSDFTFECGMGMLHGYVKVVNNLNKVNLDAIKKEIKNYKPASGNFGG